MPSKEAVSALQSHLAQQADGTYWEQSAASATTGYIRQRDGGNAAARVYNAAKVVLETQQYSLLTVLGSRRGNGAVHMCACVHVQVS